MDLRQLHVQICGLSAAGKNLQISLRLPSSCSGSMVTQAKYHSTLMDSLLNHVEYVSGMVTFRRFEQQVRLFYFGIVWHNRSGLTFLKNGRSKLLEKAINSYCHLYSSFLLRKLHVQWVFTCCSIMDFIHDIEDSWCCVFWYWLNFKIKEHQLFKCQPGVKWWRLLCAE